MSVRTSLLTAEVIAQLTAIRTSLVTAEIITAPLPDQVTGLTANQTGAREIALSWEEPNDNGDPIIGYRINFESPIGGGFSVLVSNTGSNSLIHEVINLSENTEFNFTVSAINSAGVGPASSPASATTGTIYQSPFNDIQDDFDSLDTGNWPDEIDGGAAFQISSGKAQWDTTDISHNHALKSASGSFVGKKVHSVYDSITGGMVMYTYLTPDDLVNFIGWELSITSLKLVSQAGTLFEFTGGDFTLASVKHVRLKDTEDNNISLQTSPNGKNWATRKVIPRPAWVTEHVIQVGGKSDGMTGIGHGELDDVNPPPTVPDQVTNLIAVATSYNKVQLIFDSPADGNDPIIGYRVQLETPIGNGFITKISNTNSVSTTVEVSGLMSETEYNFQVAAINSIGIGQYSSPDSAITFAGSLLARPGSMTRVSLGVKI